MLIDTTLREGAQLFGAYFSLETKTAIVSGLTALGVEEIEVGWVGQEGLEELVQAAAPLTPETALGVWSPCRQADIRKAASLGVDRINIGVPVSDLHIKQRLGTDRDGLLEKLASTVLLASFLDINYISVGLEDMSRADRSFVLEAVRIAQEMGASRVRFSDSLGMMTPPEMAELVETAREEIDIHTAIHCHDDFGMATANALTALGVGADFADGSLLGIGERSGIAATEELAAFLALKENSRKYDTRVLRPLCRIVSDAAQIPIPRTKSVVGDDIFACESGLHVHALGTSPELFEPYTPEAVGADRRLAVGSKSGQKAVANALEEKGLAYPRQELPALVSAVRRLSWELERPLTPDELVRLAHNQ